MLKKIQFYNVTTDKLMYKNNPLALFQLKNKIKSAVNIKLLNFDLCCFLKTYLPVLQKCKQLTIRPVFGFPINEFSILFQKMM